MRRFVQHSFLKPEKVAEYVQLHANTWPGVLEMIQSCHLHNYSISLRGSELVSYFEYTGTDYEADMARMAADRVTQQWWTHTHPCFLYHEQGVYADDFQEIFFAP